MASRRGRRDTEEGRGEVQLTIDTSDPRPIETQIVDEVRRAVTLGTLKAEEALPPVRRLAAELRVNPGAVARAYQALEAQGIVQMRWGRGPVVRGETSADAGRAALLPPGVDRAHRAARRNRNAPRELAHALRAPAESTDASASPEAHPAGAAPR